MSADTVRVGHLHRRMRLHRLSDASALDRATNRLADTLADHLTAGPALDGSGKHGHLCIRELSISVRVPSSRLQDDAYIAASWASEITGALVRLMRESHETAHYRKVGEDVVWYRSDSDAVMDVAMSISCGDFGRAWAWQQLGLCDATNLAKASPSERASVVAAVLQAHPTLIVPVLVQLAERDLLDALAFSSAQWTQLALLTRKTMPSRQEGKNPTRSVDRIVRAIALSPLSRLARLEVRVSADRRRSIATLVLASVAPELATDDSAVVIVETKLFPASDYDYDLADGVDRQDASSIIDLNEKDPADRATDSARQSLTFSHEAATSDNTLPSHPGDLDNSERQTTSSPDKTPDTASNELDGIAVDSTASDDGSEWTEYGGLLFLHNLNCVRRLGNKTPEALATAPLRDVLIALASKLTGATLDDPAVLAFAGLMRSEREPRVRTSDRDDTSVELDEYEHAAIDELFHQIVDELAIRLARTESTKHELVRFVTQRNARIVADPGWITIELPIDSVDISIRASGLDLDPGYVPMIGCVIVFSYTELHSVPEHMHEHGYERREGGER